jgi:hypothetical protein
VGAILPNNGWKVCFFVLSIQNFHHTLGSCAGTDWFLGLASIKPERSGYTWFELQPSNVPHGQEDLVYGYCLFFEIQYYP